MKRAATRTHLARAMNANPATSADHLKIVDPPRTAGRVTTGHRAMTVVLATLVTIVALATIAAHAMTVARVTIAALATTVVRPDDGRVIDPSRLAAVGLAAFALLASARAYSATDEALAHFEAAKAAYDAEEFSKARALMELALASGLEGPAIHYNLGAAAYRGGDLPRAERAFREVARTPSMAALAYYNLGLVALERRDEAEARDWFERTLQASPDARLAQLASRRLAELPETWAPGQWTYYSRGGFGYDDNVSLRSSSVEGSASGNQDSYGELIFAGSYSIGAWRIDTGGAMLEYLDQDEYSQSSLSLGGARGFRLDNWYFELGAYGAEYSLGGEPFERNVTAAAQATRVFYGGSRLRSYVRASKVDGKGDFSGLTGERTDVSLYYDRSWRRWTFGAHTRLQLNDSEDPVFATRWLQVGADLRYSASPMWGVVASAALRRISHPAESATLAGWDDNRASVLFGVTRMLRKQMQLFVRCQLERNDSPVAGYDYDRNWIAASVETWR